MPRLTDQQEVSIKAQKAAEGTVVKEMEEKREQLIDTANKILANEGFVKNVLERHLGFLVQQHIRELIDSDDVLSDEMSNFIRSVIQYIHDNMPKQVLPLEHKK